MFEFYRDSFAFPNELLWAYQFDPVTGKTRFTRRLPKPSYAHRCFVLVRAARQFLYHARFDPHGPILADTEYLRRIRQVVARNPRVPGAERRTVIVPGFGNLRQFSQEREQLLKAACGGAWQSYALRSHWRMLFPISRRHQARTAASLAAAVERGEAPIIHLVRFPKLTINHGMLVFGASPCPDGLRFTAYDPNQPREPTTLVFHADTRSFTLPANPYWAGGRVDIIEIYRSWFL